MGKLLNWPPVGYKRWALLQRINELERAITREWSQKRQDELDNLRKDLADTES